VAGIGQGAIQMSVPEMDDVAGHAYRRIRGCCFFFHLGSAGTNSEASAKKASAEMAIHQWSETAVEETLRQGA